MNVYFRTNAQHVSVYDMQESVTLVNENLGVFMRNWEIVLSGIQKSPEGS